MPEPIPATDYDLELNKLLSSAMKGSTPVVDRVEGDIAVIEVGGDMIDLPISALPFSVKEGEPINMRVVDRLEGKMAVIEVAPGKTVDIPLKSLPPKVQEGDMIDMRGILKE